MVNFQQIFLDSFEIIFTWHHEKGNTWALLSVLFPLLLVKRNQEKVISVRGHSRLSSSRLKVIVTYQKTLFMDSGFLKRTCLGKGIAYEMLINTAMKEKCFKSNLVLFFFGWVAWDDVSRTYFRSLHIFTSYKKTWIFTALSLLQWWVNLRILLNHHLSFCQIQNSIRLNWI